MAEAAKRGGRDEQGNVVGGGTALSKPLAVGGCSNAEAAAGAPPPGAAARGWVRMEVAAPRYDANKQPRGSRRVIHHFPFRGTHTAIKLRMGGLWLELSTGGGAWGWDSDAAFFRSVKHGVVAELGLSVVTDLVPTASCPRLPDAPPRAPLLPLPAEVKGMPLSVWRLAYEPHPRIFINNWHDLKATGQKGGDATVRLLGFDEDGSSIQMQLVALEAVLQREQQRAAAVAATPRFVELPTLGQLGTFDEVWRRCTQGEHPWVVEEVEGRDRGFAAWRYVTGGSTEAVTHRWHRIASLLGLVLAEAELQDCDWETAVEWLEADRISEGRSLGGYLRYRQEEQREGRRTAGLAVYPGCRGNKIHPAVVAVAASVHEELERAEVLAATDCHAQRSACEAMEEDGWASF